MLVAEFAGIDGIGNSKGKVIASGIVEHAPYRGISCGTALDAWSSHPAEFGFGVGAGALVGIDDRGFPIQGDRFRTDRRVCLHAEYQFLNAGGVRLAGRERNMQARGFMLNLDGVSCDPCCGHGAFPCRCSFRCVSCINGSGHYTARKRSRKAFADKKGKRVQGGTGRGQDKGFTSREATCHPAWQEKGVWLAVACRTLGVHDVAPSVMQSRRPGGSKTLQVVFVSNLYPRPDEPQRGLFNAALIRALVPVAAERGLGIDVLVPVAVRNPCRFGAVRGWQVPAPAACGARVTYVPYLHIPYLGRPLAGWLCRQALRPMAARFREAVGVVGSWLYPDGVAAGAVARAVGRPYLTRLHGSDRFHLDARLRKHAAKMCLAQSQAVCVNAVSMRDELVQRGIRAAHIHVIPNGVDRTRFHPADATRERERTVLWAGNFVAVKNPERALRAFRLLRAGTSTQDSVRLLMAGDGPLRGQMQQKVREWGLSDDVSFLGSIAPDVLAETMRRVQGLLLTSDSEGMPNVVLESLASGTPVVSVAAGDTRRVIQAGLNGFCVVATEAQLDQALADALRDTLQTRWNPQAIAATVAGYDWSRAAERLLALIGEGYDDA